MLGIGFGREHDGQSGGTPDRNPLLNLALDARHAYTITRRGIAIGGNESGFALVQLRRDPAHQDWFAPTACIKVESRERSCGTALVDTGITGMFLTVPPDQLPSGGADTSLPDRTAIAIELAPADGVRAATGYVVRTGEADDAAAPSSVILAGIGKRPTFVNTGVHVLNRFDYLYDADAGLVGYRLCVEAASSAEAAGPASARSSRRPSRRPSLRLTTASHAKGFSRCSNEPRYFPP